MFNRFATFGFLFSSSAFGVSSQCIQGVDWKPFCSRPEALGIRCLIQSGTGAVDYCAPETAGCAEIGGCFGDVPPGFWYPIQENNQPYRCRCGCVGSADTQFETTMGAFSGQELYVRRNEKLLQVSTLDSLDTPWLSSPKTINSLMASKSHEPSYHIVTKSGLGVIASPGHPVLVANKEGTPTQMKKASDLSIGEHLLTHEGSADEVVRVTQVDYKDELMNFNVASSKSAEHIVSMNGILLGDYAWQERLNSRDARVLLRADVARELMRER